jgi:hypothetical protein
MAEAKRSSRKRATTKRTRRRKPKGTAGKYHCQLCGRGGFDHPQQVKAHRVKKHGEAWQGSKKAKATRARRASSRATKAGTRLPTEPTRKRRAPSGGRRSSQSTKSDAVDRMFDAAPLEVLVEALIRRIPAERVR